MAGYLEDCTTDLAENGWSDWLCRDTMICVKADSVSWAVTDGPQAYCACPGFWGLSYDSESEACVKGPAYNMYLAGVVVVSLLDFALVSLALVVARTVFRSKTHKSTGAVALATYSSIFGCVFVAIMPVLLVVRSDVALKLDLVAPESLDERKSTAIWKAVQIVFVCMIVSATSASLVLMVAWLSVLLAMRTMSKSSGRLRKGMKIVSISIVFIVLLLVVVLIIDQISLLFLVGAFSLLFSAGLFSVVALKLARVIDSNAATRVVSTSSPSHHSSSGGGSSKRLSAVAGRMRRTALSLVGWTLCTLILLTVHVVLPEPRELYPSNKVGAGPTTLVLVNVGSVGMLWSVVWYLFVTTNSASQRASKTISNTTDTATGTANSATG